MYMYINNTWMTAKRRFLCKYLSSHWLHSFTTVNSRSYIRLTKQYHHLDQHCQTYNSNYSVCQQYCTQMFKSKRSFQYIWVLKIHLSYHPYQWFMMQDKWKFLESSWSVIATSPPHNLKLSPFKILLGLFAVLFCDNRLPLLINQLKRW